MALAALAMICAIGLIATSGWLISRAWERPPVLALTVAVVAVRAFGIGRGVFRYAERLVSHDAAFRGLSRLRELIVGRMAVLMPAGTPGIQRGDSLRRVVDDVDSVAELGLRALLPGSVAVLIGGVTVAFVAWLVPLAGVALALTLLAAGMLTPWLGSRVAARATVAEVNLRGELAARVAGQLEACAELVAANADDRELSRIAAIDGELTRVQIRTARAVGLTTAIGVLAQGLALVCAAVFAVPAVRSGELPGTELAVVILIPLVAFELVAGLPAAALALAKVRASSERIVDLTDRPDPVPDPTDPAPRPAPRPPGNADGSIGLRVTDLSVRWPGSSEQAVKDVSFNLPPGKTLAIVGPSGSGKSTLAAALARFVPYSGSIMIGGIEADSMSGDTVRELIGWGEQQPHLFDSTIAENVRLARPGATDEQVLNALAAAGAGPWIATLPQGIDTPVGQHGKAVSGGQRQRIGLARMILARPPVMVFDEPTEHLDAASVDDLMNDLLSAAAGHSLIVISHLLPGLTDVDHVLVLTDGRVIEEGPPEQLLAADAWFRRQHDRQRRSRRSGWAMTPASSSSAAATTP